MDRRTFISGVALSLLAATLVARAQQAAKVYRIGRLSLSAFDARPGHETNDAVLDGLRELGYVEGRDFLLERRDANGISDRLPKLAEELVRIPVDVLLVTGVTATAAARRATGTIPIVCMMGDPVGQGFVKSLAHPGANITGVTLNTGGSDLGGKFLQLLMEVFPPLSPSGLLKSIHNPATAPTVFFPATSLSAMRLVTAEIRDPDGLDQALATLINSRIQALTSDGD